MTTSAPDPVDARARRVAEAVPTWRHELAELGGRNTLLWYRDLPSGTLDLTVAHPSGVAKLLSGHTTRLSELVREPVAFAEACRRSRAVRAKIVELAEEHGLATGFIAVGMASWRLPGATVPPRAPVLLRTCLLAPTDASYQDFTVDLGPEVEFNPVLGHYLRAEQGIEVDGPQLAQLANAGQGFDPRPAYDALEGLCAHVDGFGIGPQLVISTFPWAKLSLVADVAAQADTLHRHDVVAALAGDPDARRALGRPLRPAAPDVDPARELVVLDADTAQQAAIEQAADGDHLVIDGPPGTGKSQTIANIAATMMGQGKRVLVVSEKRAALDAMHRRLDHVGLGDLVLDVREDPVGARGVAAVVGARLDQLEAGESGESGGDARVPGRPDRETVRELVQHRRTLQDHHESLHQERDPWGASVLDAQQALTQLSARSRPPVSRVRLDAATLRTLQRDQLAELSASLAEAARLGAWAPGPGQDPWYAAHLTSEEDAARALDMVQRLTSGALDQARAVMTTMAADAGLPAPVSLEQWTEQLVLVERVRETLDVFRPQVYDAPLDDLVAATGGQDQRGQGDLTMVMRARLRRQARDLLRPGRPPADLPGRLVAAQQERDQWQHLAGRAARPEAPGSLEEAQQVHTPLRRDLDWLTEVLRDSPLGQDLATTHPDLALERLLRLADRQDRLTAVPLAYGRLQELREAGLGPVVDDLARRGVDPQDVSAELEFVWWTSLLADIAERDPRYGRHDGDALRSATRAFITTDRRHLADNAARVRQAVHARARRTLAAHPQQVALVREQLVAAAAPGGLSALLRTQQAAPDVLASVSPCWMMSPLVAGMVMPPGRWFDAVIIDEASRIPVSHAIPAVSRAAQVVVVGDPRQLPPRPFVTSVDERLEQAAEDLPAEQEGQSVLEALWGVVPVRRLCTHYRSLDERLFEPVNRELYDGRLATFPGVLVGPVLRHQVVAGDREAEVDRVVQLVLEHARSRAGQSLGVVTLDRAHAEEVDLALRDAVARAPDLITSFRETALEPFFVKPLEQVQGDVRDVIVLSLGGGPEEPGPGPLSRLDGQHWAAVGLTRSRRRTVVVSGFELAADEQAVPGVALLRRVLEHAAADPTTVGRPRALVADLATRLRSEGLVVHEGYGRGARRVELAVEDPGRPGRPLVAVETDMTDMTDMAGGVDGAGGAGGAGGTSTRERERLRFEQLTRLGWTPVRVWSTDLFRDPARDVARVAYAVRDAGGGPGRG